jgi:hypothetical protein
MNNPIIDTTIDFIDVQNPDNLKYLNTYNYFESKNRLDTVNQIFTQYLGKNYILIIILFVINLFVLIILLGNLV